MIPPHTNPAPEHLEHTFKHGVMTRIQDGAVLPGRGQTVPEEQQKVGVSRVVFFVFLAVKCGFNTSFRQNAPERINIWPLITVILHGAAVGFPLCALAVSSGVGKKLTNSLDWSGVVFRQQGILVDWTEKVLVGFGFFFFLVWLNVSWISYILLFWISCWVDSLFESLKLKVVQQVMF